MKTHVEFRSDRFPAYEDEDRQINSDRYGKRLAEFLAEGLRKEGFAPQDLVAEDWGWEVPIANDGFRLWVGCGSHGEDPGGFLCYIEPHEPYIRRCFKKVDVRERIESLQQALDRILCEAAGIRDKRWYTHGEFNKPGV